MHASIDQLLSLRDGVPVDAEAMRHLDDCSLCTNELARLRQLQRRMQSLPELDPPAAIWSRIQARAAAPAAPRHSRIGLAVAAALVVAVVSGLLMRQPASPSLQAPLAMPAESAAADEVPLEELVAQSRELEEILQHLPGRPAVERVSLAATIDTIEQRVQWLDQQISYAPADALNDAQTYRLWSERVALMDSLVKVRYAEGGHLSF